ncbi:S-adenosyl-L-methionine-dependent methyltransferase [Hesseltinella vesiculosa]|uniref:S-adenosyl-L-methionine-dependent methyltransferase n=1 Tax=Hesseltinella vesiculosa TaxID=101127 RepID=A0A1X2GRR5_9FUNG|nr:S-adenosyl-L-methionine-dependent methyltransferase [Hesseltinella vesiculosa]
MIPTPDLSHLTHKDFDHIYEPAEDTFLLLDALEQDANDLKTMKPSVCLEIGSGSGCVTSFLAKIVGNQAVYLTTDINIRACHATCHTALANQAHNVETIQTSLVDGLLPRLKHKVDVMCFNPPYVVTTSEEVGSHGIEAAWAGGIDGREVIDQLLPLVTDLLSATGIFYLLLINENRPLEVMKILDLQYNLECKMLMERRAGRERQYIITVRHRERLPQLK